jgi:toxin HigB-1
MILSYRGKRTETFAAGDLVRVFQGFERQAYKRLEILDAAISIEELRVLPSNRFEALQHNLPGQFSICINLQWRICFHWMQGDAGPTNVEIVDFH